MTNPNKNEQINKNADWTTSWTLTLFFFVKLKSEVTEQSSHRPLWEPAVIPPKPTQLRNDWSTEIVYSSPTRRFWEREGSARLCDCMGKSQSPALHRALTAGNLRKHDSLRYFCPKSFPEVHPTKTRPVSLCGRGHEYSLFISVTRVNLK